MVAAEFWEQGDLEKNVLEQQPIVRVVAGCGFIYGRLFVFIVIVLAGQCNKCSLCNCGFSPPLLSAHDGQKLCGTATQDAVRFHRLCVLICIQGNETYKQCSTRFKHSHNLTE